VLSGGQGRVTGPGGPLQGFSISEVSRRRYRLPGPSWDCPVFRSITDLVVDIRFPTPASPFLRPRGFPKIRHPAPRYRKLPRLGLPFRVHPTDTAGVLRGPGRPHEVYSPYSDINSKVHSPGFPNPVRSAFRVFHPLDGLLPSSFPTSRAGTTHGVQPSRAFPLHRAVHLAAPIPSCRF
jgi:hypothetical protein